MKVFISWSGDTSKAVAQAFYDWLPNVIQAIEPWISSDSIGKGERWNHILMSELDVTDIGIICVTPENISSQWLLFESGALTKSIDSKKVCPVLFNMNTSDLTGPLTQFQMTLTNHDDIFRLLCTINNSLGENVLSEKNMYESFELWWPKFDSLLKEINLDPAINSKIKRSEYEIIVETLNIVRTMRSNIYKSEEDFVLASYDPKFVKKSMIYIDRIQNEIINSLHNKDSFSLDDIRDTIGHYAKSYNLLNQEVIYLEKNLLYSLYRIGDIQYQMKK